jgi:hypothetical protein
MTELRIAELLDVLEKLLQQIEPLRTRTRQMEKELTEVQQEYEAKLGPANAEADRLEATKLSLQARLNREPAPPPPREAITAPTPPPATIETRAEPTMPPPPRPRESLRTARKRALLDFIFNFTDSGPVIEKINAIVDDDRRELGDMLELLTWGEIWKARTDWETLDEQALRLDEWRVALEQRVAYWTEEIKRLEDDPRYSLRSELDDLLRSRERKNELLAKEVADLERQWAEQVAGGER